MTVDFRLWHEIFGLTREEWRAMHTLAMEDREHEISALATAARLRGEPERSVRGAVATATEELLNNSFVIETLRQRLEEAKQMNEALLAAALGASVPLWVDQIVREDWSEERRRREAEECSTVVASKGDVILYKGGKKGETAGAFNALAKGVALLSFQPGGVVAFGTRYTVVEGRCRTSQP